MAEITASMVKDLRESTGAGMMECKKALAQAEGDFDKAVKILRETSAQKIEKRAERTAAEGLAEVALNADATAGAVVELNSETDFVARNDGFVAATKAMAAAALANKTDSVDALSTTKLADGKTAGETVTGLAATIGEKITLTNAAYHAADVVAGYVHPPGKIGVLIGAKLNGVKDRAAIAEALRDVAMHIAAASPRFLVEAEVDSATLESEKEVYAAIARKEGKKEELIPRIVDGKVKSFYKEKCLLLQPFVKDPDKSVKQFLDAAAKAAGGTLEVTRFVRFKVGEGSK